MCAICWASHSTFTQLEPRTEEKKWSEAFTIWCSVGIYVSQISSIYMLHVGRSFGLDATRSSWTSSFFWFGNFHWRKSEGYIHLFGVSGMLCVRRFPRFCCLCIKQLNGTCSAGSRTRYGCWRSSVFAVEQTSCVQADLVFLCISKSVVLL